MYLGTINHNRLMCGGCTTWWVLTNTWNHFMKPFQNRTKQSFPTTPDVSLCPFKLFPSSHPHSLITSDLLFVITDCIFVFSIFVNYHLLIFLLLSVFHYYFVEILYVFNICLCQIHVLQIVPYGGNICFYSCYGFSLSSSVDIDMTLGWLLVTTL